MTKLLLTATLAAAFALAQQPAHAPAPPAEPAAQSEAGQHGDGQVPHGGAEAVHPGGEVGHGQSAGAQHAEAAAKHGEGHEEHPMPNEIWWKWANFAILVALLGWLIKKNAGPFFQARTEAIQSGIREAALVRQDAENRAGDIERRVANLSAEVEQLRRQSTEEIAREGERSRQETEAQIRKIQAQAEADIASAAKHASQQLKAYSAQLALELAERQIRERLTPANQRQLADSFVQDLNNNKAVEN